MNPTEDQQKVLDVAYNLGFEVPNDYSGRSMYGKECMGIVGDDFICVIEEAASLGLRNARYDSFGRDYIVYWPSIKPIENYEE